MRTMQRRLLSLASFTYHDKTTLTFKATTRLGAQAKRKAGGLVPAGVPDVLFRADLPLD